jgi:hypothetical protein
MRTGHGHKHRVRRLSRRIRPPVNSTAAGAPTPDPGPTAPHFGLLLRAAALDAILSRNKQGLAGLQERAAA